MIKLTGLALVIFGLLSIFAHPNTAAVLLIAGVAMIWGGA